MSLNDTEKPAARYTLRPTFTPLPYAKRANDHEGSNGTIAHATTKGNGAAGGTAHSAPDTADDATRAGSFPNAALSSPTDAPGSSRRAVNPILRATNEDDDLYDPYSDYHDGTLQNLEFERDPWR